ncbi:MAG: response regulator receiver [Osedax symbiont Rs1]|nr:MAG: response regulator receiver [Osedax symbiont Rs1]
MSKLTTVILVMCISVFAIVKATAAETKTADDNSWIASLQTKTPAAGFELAIKMSRMAVKKIQPDVAMLHKLRPIYATDPNSLIAGSQVVAINYQTVAAANNYWRK